MNKQLDQVHIQGFKSIRDQTIQLEDLNVLIGANGAGKSNFISMFRFLNEMVAQNLQVFVGQSGGANTFFYHGSKITPAFSLYLEFGDNVYHVVFVSSSDQRLIFKDERCAYKPSGNVIFARGHQETFLVEQAKDHPRRIADHVLKALKGWQVYHFHDTSATAAVKRLGDLHDNRFLRPDASNLAAYLYFLRERHHAYYTNIVDTIRLVAPFFRDFELDSNRLYESQIRLEWSEFGNPIPFDASALSDGTLRFICLAVLLMQPELPSAVIIDEPELGLHPYALVLLASLLKSAATRTQVIVSTQSVPLVNQFDPEQVIVVDREEGASIFKRLSSENLEDWLEDYGVGELWEKNLIGGRPR
ncbi:MAG: AAA family ATPase [Anaerolineae bacterium]|jgi:predicted ATPase|nr:AAA family ATPase [Anaerolineae bacterium]